jgi:amino acid transporter
MTAPNLPNEPFDAPAALATPIAGEAENHHLRRQLNLRDLVFSQVLSVVGSAWVGIAAGLGHAQTLVWIFAMTAFYLPMAVAVYFLNREMPLEGGLYVWARRAFGDTAGFLVAWNIWAYGITTIAVIFSQLPTEFAYMAGPSAAWIPENHVITLSGLTLLLLALAFAAFRGLALGKWIHNISSASMMLAFALLIIAPLYAYFHHAPIHYTPVEFHLPPRTLTSLALVGQILFASSGLEYVAIMAGETHAPSRLIGRSVVVASPIIVIMFIMGTASVLSFHEFSHSKIDYVAPIPQTLTLAFGASGLGHILASLAILLLQIRILGTASFLFTGVTRLPMTAGWDHLIPAWFSRLHPRYCTPTNSIFFGAALVAGLLVLASVGTHAAQAFEILNNGSSELYGLAYMAMFAIPIAGASFLRKRIPWWVMWLCGLGFMTTLFTVLLETYPFIDDPHPMQFAVKIVGATLLTNLLGYAFYKLRSKPNTVGQT